MILTVIRAFFNAVLFLMALFVLVILGVAIGIFIEGLL